MVFCKEDESLEDEGRDGQLSEADNNQMRASSKLVLLQLNKKLPKNSPSTILWSFGIWSKLERWKSSISGCLGSWPKIKKIVVLKCHLLSYANNSKPFLDLIVVCDEKWINVCMTTWDDQLSGWTEEKLQSTPQSQTCAKQMVMVTVWWSAASLIH